MKIACLQFNAVYRNIDANLEIIEQMVREANADVCVIPELAITGYFFRTTSEIAPLAQPVDGPIVQRLARLAAQTGSAIITGFLEADGDRFFNSAIALHSDGKLAGHYRKVHRFYMETVVFTAGDLGFPVFDLVTRSGAIRTGMMVCYDWRFPEAARSLALAGAEFIAVPSNIVTTTGMLHLTLQVRAFENKVILAFANRTGSETNGDETLTFQGKSAIVNYNGEIRAIASMSGTECIAADLDPNKTHDKQINQYNDIIEDRRPESYR